VFLSVSLSVSVYFWCFWVFLCILCVSGCFWVLLGASECYCVYAVAGNRQHLHRCWRVGRAVFGGRVWAILWNVVACK